MRAVVFLLLAAVAAPVSAAPDRDAPKTEKTEKKKTTSAGPKGKDNKGTKADKPADGKPARTPGPHDAQVVAALEKIVSAGRAGRAQAIADFHKIAPTAIEAIGEWIAREHPTELADRRKVLVEIAAAIPDKRGNWPTPARQSRKEKKADDDLDWLAELADVDLPGVDEVIADVVGIRALSATKEVRATQILLDVAFSDESMIYRDECGRYIRKMEAVSIPALTRESQSKNGIRRRYATWQLERMDRQDAFKALSAATGDEVVQVAILEAFRDIKYREGVDAVWAYVDAPAPRVRAAAREAWMAYIVGPPPPPAPRQFLKLPGGKQTKKPKPLWLTYRELADTVLRKAANELLHEDYVIEEQNIDDNVRQAKAQPIDLEEVTKRLFDYYDAERTKKDVAAWQAAKAKADGGDLVAAAQMIDRLVAVNADRPQRAEMAKVYVALGKQLEGGQKWADAAAAFSKAHGLDPQKATLAAQHFTLGKALEAQGKDGGPDFRRAIALDPEYAPAKQAADAAPSAGDGKPVWMLYAAIGAGGIALLLFGAAMMRRRTAS